MKKFMLLGTSLCLFFIPLSAIAAPVITEVFANPDDEDHDELLELYNPDATAVDLTGYTLTDGDALDEVVVWSVLEQGSLKDADAVLGTLMIPARSFAVVVDAEFSQGSQPIDVPPGTVILTTENTTIGNGLATTDPVSLIDANGKVVSAYGTPLINDDWRNRDDDGLDGIPFNPGDAVSVERIEPLGQDEEGNWQASLEAVGHSVGFLSTATEEPDPDDEDPNNNPPPSNDSDPTPPNTPPAPPSPPLKTCSTEVKIHELLPNPEGSDEVGEFIELFFSGAAPLSLEGWTVADSSGHRYLFPKKEMAPNGFLVLDRPTTGIALNNTGEEIVTLTCGTGSIVDEVRYAGPVEEGWSWSRSGTGFVWSVTPTPGQPNVIKASNTPPVASFSLEGKKEVGSKLTFDASGSTDADDDRLTFAWEFGDGEIGEGKVITHAYRRAASLTVRLTVSDGTEEEVVTKDLTIDREPKPEDASKEKKTPEPEKNKSATTPRVRSTSDDVLVTELLPNPEGPDAEEEWIELTNFGNEVVDLTGWTLTDEKTSYVFDGKTLKAGARLLLERPESKISLNNTEDELYLIDAFGRILHGVAYSSAKKGESFSRKEKTTEWGWTVQPTPSAENAFSSFEEDSDEEKEASDERDEETVSALVSESVSVKSSSIPFVTFLELQTMEKGSEVEVQGTVVNVPGERGVQKLYIQEGEQELQIYSHQKKFPSLNKGDEIAVFGTVSEAGGEKRVNIREASDIRVLRLAPAGEGVESVAPIVAGATDGLKSEPVDSSTFVNPALAADASPNDSAASSASPMFYWGFGILVVVNVAAWFWIKKNYFSLARKPGQGE